MRDLFGAWAVTKPVTPPGNTGNTDAKSPVLPIFSSNINAVTPVTPVTPENGSSVHVRDHQDMVDDYEERAAIMEYDAHLPRAEAERLAWLEVFGVDKA